MTKGRIFLIIFFILLILAIDAVQYKFAFDRDTGQPLYRIIAYGISGVFSVTYRDRHESADREVDLSKMPVVFRDVAAPYKNAARTGVFILAGIFFLKIAFTEAKK